MEAEKLTFPGELSFQRSQCTAGLTVATIFRVLFKKLFCGNSLLRQKIRLNDYTFAFFIENMP
jgi:hypothetical protein